MTCYKCNGTGLWGGVDNDLYHCDECKTCKTIAFNTLGTNRAVLHILITMPHGIGVSDQPFESSNKYISEAALVEMLEGMKRNALPPEHVQCDEVIGHNAAIDAAIEKIKEMK